MNSAAPTLRIDQASALDAACEDAIASVRHFGELLDRLGQHEEAQMVLATGLELKQYRRAEVIDDLDRERLQRVLRNG